MTFSEIFAAYEQQSLEAAELARVRPGDYVICMDDTTPFRLHPDGTLRISGGEGTSIYHSAHKAIAMRHAIDLQTGARQINSSALIRAKLVTDWAKQRREHLDALAQMIRANVSNLDA